VWWNVNAAQDRARELGKAINRYHAPSPAGEGGFCRRGAITT
jgi:hypothetical protein